MNPWKVLGVHRRSSDAEIRDAYYALARRHHPDQGGDAAKFAEAAAAYALLETAALRRRWLNSQPRHDCKACGGSGVVKKTKSLTTKSYSTCMPCGGSGIIMRPARAGEAIAVGGAKPKKGKVL